MYLKKFKFLFIGTTINVAIDKCDDISFHGTQSVHLHSFLFFVFFSIVAWDLRKRIPFLSPGRRMRAIMIPA